MFTLIIQPITLGLYRNHTVIRQSVTVSLDQSWDCVWSVSLSLVFGFRNIFFRYHDNSMEMCYCLRFLFCIFHFCLSLIVSWDLFSHYVDVYENAPNTFTREKVYTNAAFDENHYEDTGASSIINPKPKVCFNIWKKTFGNFSNWYNNVHNWPPYALTVLCLFSCIRWAMQG